MKKKIISILGNGLPYGVAFFAFCALVGYFFHFPAKQYLIISGVLAAFVWLMNGYVYNRFSKPIKELEQISIEIGESESVLLEAPANHLVEESLQPGKLVLTSQRLIFQSHPKASAGQTEFVWELFTLKPFRFHKSMFNAGGEFLMQKENGDTIMFEVNELVKWKNAITPLIKNPKTGSRSNI